MKFLYFIFLLKPSFPETSFFTFDFLYQQIKYLFFWRYFIICMIFLEGLSIKMLVLLLKITLYDDKKM